ncbi:MAG: redoxin domain-containing protein [Planctomycetes bacterium]|nr:redoxin domain-containing protein [Planctomycetota bacterium]MCW8136300.1 redoxin domain-containing protein [Planctomycetota bacterium]
MTTGLRTLVAALALFATLFAVGGFIASQDKEPEPEPIRQAPKPIDPRQWRIGKLIDDVEFTDVDGKQGKLSDYKGKVLVIAITNSGCPICKKFAPALNEHHEAWAKQGVEFLLLNPMEHETLDDCKAAIKRYGFKARYVHDPKAALARALKADTTGDCFVLDGSRTLRYRGAVSDQYGFGYALDAPRVAYLNNALKDVLAGRELHTPATWAPGCELDLEAAEPAGDITWHNRVSRIIQHNCERCHRDGENGPFTLVSYADVKGNRAMVRRQVARKLMPPWFANPEHGDFSNDMSLSDDDRNALLSWIDNGCPEGDAKDAPAPLKWTKGWLIGEPEVVYELPQVEKIPAQGTVSYKYQIVTTSFEEDRWVKAMEIRPTATQNVHHVLVFLEFAKGHPRAHEQPNDRGGLNGYFMGMVPGMGHVEFDDGMGKFLPKGAKLHFQMHYTTNGEEAEDRTKLGLIFCKERPKIEVVTKGIANPFFSIPPGADNHEVKSSFTLDRKTRLLSFCPHMHVRGKAYRYVAHMPDGTEKILLDVPRYDFNWQLLYILREPIDLPKGTKIVCHGWFDNSDKNPANPDPKATVRFGEQTWEEMQIGYINWYALE